MSGDENKRVPVGPHVQVETKQDGTPVNRPVRFSWDNETWLQTIEQAERIGTELLEGARLARELTGGIARVRVEGTLHADGTHEQKVTRLAPVQGDYSRGGKPPGTIDWAEHELAWRAYHRDFPGVDQDAERIAERGGFGYHELVRFLGREPTTWQPKE